MLKVLTQPVTAFSQNSNLLICEQTQQGVIIDPGGDTDKLISLIEEQGCSLKAILLTHGHLDHVGGAKILAEHFKINIHGPHIGDKYWLDALLRQSEMFNFAPCEPFTPDRWFNAGDVFSFGSLSLEVRFTPGHTPGHVIFIAHQSKKVFVGDVIFRGSVGRTDFPGGNSAVLKLSIENEIYTLDDDYTVFPGHGPNTTVGHEKQTNPFTSSRYG